jgi:hypothetical protein
MATALATPFLWAVRAAGLLVSPFIEMFLVPMASRTRLMITPWLICYKINHKTPIPNSQGENQ